MSDWVCQKCGTINEDIFDITPTTTLQVEHLESFYRKRLELETQGKSWEYKCERCNEKRI